MVDSSDFETDVGTMDVYARGADPVYVTAPSSSQQEEGVKPLDRLPAQWWNWFLHEATNRFSNYKAYISNALAELDNLLDLSAITPDDTKTNQLKGMFENEYLQKYLPEVVSDTSTFSVDAAKESSILVSNDDGNNGFDIKKVPYSPCLIYNAQSITTIKTITLPANSPYDGQCFKVVFKNGHNCADDSTPMTLNGKPVLVNVNGTLSALPIHTMTEGGETVYKSLQANTVFDVYYDANYDGNNNDAFVIIGNPVVLSSATYSIYANGEQANFPSYIKNIIHFAKTLTIDHSIDGSNKQINLESAEFRGIRFETDTKYYAYGSLNLSAHAINAANAINKIFGRINLSEFSFGQTATVKFSTKKYGCGSFQGGTGFYQPLNADNYLQLTSAVGPFVGTPVSSEMWFESITIIVYGDK